MFYCFSILFSFLIKHCNIGFDNYVILKINKLTYFSTVGETIFFCKIIQAAPGCIKCCTFVQDLCCFIFAGACEVVCLPLCGRLNKPAV